MQRVRMLLPFLRENGWQAEVLAVEPEQVAGPHDPWLVAGLPADIRVHRVKALGLGWTRMPGLGTLGLRALKSLAKTGDGLIAKGGFDLVYFSTTVFEVHLLGPRWKRKFRVPFVMDYQDPWVNDYYREHPDIVPPGGRVKYALAEALHRWMEPRVLRECVGITSVSASYPKQLAQRYPWLDKLPCLVQPFPGSRRDLERLPGTATAQPYFDRQDGYIHWVYIGVVIPGMFPVLHALFRAISTAMKPECLAKLKMHFIGTSYAPAGRAYPVVLPLAAQYGLIDHVQEQCTRIPYTQALQCLSESNALLAFGSDDPTYTASKIYPYLLVRKPLLAIYHEKSSVIELIRQVGGAVCIPFSLPMDQNAVVLTIAKLWLEDNKFSTPIMLNDSAFRPYTDLDSAKVLCHFFEERLLNV